MEEATYLTGLAAAYEGLDLAEDVMVIRRRIATLHERTSSPADRGFSCRPVWDVIGIVG